MAWTATSDEVKDLRREAGALKEVVAELTLENRLLKNGRYVMVGQLTSEDISINPARIFFKRAQLLGVGGVSRTQVEDAVKLVERGIAQAANWADAAA